MLALFDDQWKEKQEECFGKWINFTFQDGLETSPEDGSTQVHNNDRNNGYIARERRRRDDKARWRVATVWESADIRPVVYRLEKEVKEGKMAMRMDRLVQSDVGLRDFLLQLLLSINTAWLRPVLEVLYNQAIPRTHTADSVNLHRFLTSRFTKNTQILSKFAINIGSSELNTRPGESL